MRPAVFLIATLDTKGEEALFMRDCLQEIGWPVRVVDVSVLGQPLFEADVARERVAAKANATLSALASAKNRADAVTAMSEGLTVLMHEVHSRGEVAGVIAIGGSGGTTLGTAAMRALPLGVPKVMLSTLVAGDVSVYVGAKDICMMHSVVDFCGVNTISEPILRNACGAVGGMAQLYLDTLVVPAVEERPKLIAASMFGVTTPCVNKAREYLNDAGLELVPFHATGSGGRIMESLITEGFFCGVLDITTTEWADEVVGGSLSAGPARLEAAARSGLPQVIAPGALDMVNFVGVNTLPEKFWGRTFHQHNQDVILMRTTAEECREIGQRIAEKLNLSTGPVTVLFPRKGLSALDIEGGIFYDSDADGALLEALQKFCRPTIEVCSLDLHINDNAFAEICCRQLMDNIRTHQGSSYA